MSEKIPVYPRSRDGGSRFGHAPANGPAQVSSFIRRIQIDAEQICNDAVDIEDARFLAADIVEICRRFVSGANGESSGESPPDGMKSGPAAGVATTAAADTDACEMADARAKLDNLSARELEIFTGLAEGHSAAEIAVRLSRSTKTINNHRTRILQKLGLKNAAELVRLALKSGLVSV